MQNWLSAWWPYAVGYAFSVFAGSVAAAGVTRPLYRDDRPLQAPTRVLGYVERVLYTSAILLQLSAFVGIWLALKVAGNWKHLEVDRSKTIEARNPFNAFLTGTAVSLLYGVLGGYLVHWLIQGMWNTAATAAGATGFTTLILTRHLRKEASGMTDRIDDGLSKLARLAPEFKMGGRIPRRLAYSLYLGSDFAAIVSAEFIAGLSAGASLEKILSEGLEAARSELKKPEPRIVLITTEGIKFEAQDRP